MTITSKLMIFIIAFILFLGIFYLIRWRFSKYLTYSVNSKNSGNVVLPTAIVFLIICSLLFLEYDNEKYYYGLGCTFCTENMPFNLTPNMDRYSSFTLLDEDGFEIVGNGFRHKKSSFRINHLLSYGYNDTSILLRYTDSLNKIRYLVSYETTYLSDKGTPSVSFRDIEHHELESIKGHYDWVILDEETANSINFKRFMCLLGIVFSFFYITRSLIKLKKRRKSTLVSYGPFVDTANNPKKL